ncbi:MAG: hypothetical protein IIC71_06770 [Acidobacteria bacterium]|nr:hypothetical protein [Acidobacteriota bacterium]
MRRTASFLGLIASAGFFILLGSIAGAADHCAFSPELGRIICDVSEPPSGGPVVDDPVVDPPVPPSLQFVYTGVDPNTGGDCYYWSSVPGGLDAWDPANDPAVIAITTSLPVCTAVPPVVVDVLGWEVFRSWALGAPDPVLSPPGSGVTGVPTWIIATPDAAIVEDVVLPDGRVLQVRGEIVVLSVDWGDGAFSNHLPGDSITPGGVAHTYVTKTCDGEQRSRRRGHLCHPFLEAYPITLVYTWEGEYRVLPNVAWIRLGTLDRVTTVDYDVDEIIGVLNG